MTGSKNSVMWCQLIFQFSTGITLKVIGDGLDSQQVTSLGQRMDVYQVQFLLPVSLDGMCNSLVCIKLLCILSVFIIIVHIQAKRGFAAEAVFVLFWREGTLEFVRR